MAANEPMQAGEQGGAGVDDAPFLSLRFDAARVRLCVGVAAFVSWINLLFCFEGLLRDAVAYGGGVVHDPFFAAADLTAGVLLVVSALRVRWTDVAGKAAPTEEGAVRRRGRVALAASVGLGAIGGLAGVILSSVAWEDALWLQVCSVVAGAASGMFIARLTLDWGAVVSSFDMRDVLAALCAAFCVQWVPFMAVTFMGPIAKAVLATALPVCSGWCLARFALDALADDKQPHQRRPIEADGSGSVAGRVAGALFCFAFVIQCVWTFNITVTSEPLDEGLFWVVFACIFVITALVMALVLYLMNRWRSYRMELFYRVAFVFGLAGSCALGVAHDFLFFSYAVVYVAYALIVPTMWMLTWSVVFMQKESAKRAFGLIFGMQYVALVLGFSTVKLVQLLVPVDQGAQLLPYFCLIAVVVLAVAYTAILPERTLLSLSPRLFRLSHESLDERCGDIAGQYGLTGREAEVFTLLARGRDVGFIEKELFISRNTVNTHRKNLYRKLDIHTQQELLSLIEDTIS